MAYKYQSFIINGTTESHAVSQLVEKLIELVPDITIEGPLFYQDNQESYPIGRTYIITHSMDDSFKLVLSNYYSSKPTLEGKPSSGSGDFKEISIFAIAGGKLRVLGYMPVGFTRESGSVSRWSGTMIYITIVTNSDYLLWNISENAPPVAVPLYNVYSPVYSADGTVYGLAYPALQAYPGGERYAQFANTYKDTLLTSGGIYPNSSSYSLALGVLNRYYYPEFDITQTGAAQNYKTVLTKKVPLYISTYYGGSSAPTGEGHRDISTDLHSRDCILAMPTEQSPSYPKGCILALDGKDYYVSNERTGYSSSGLCTYKLFEL